MTILYLIITVAIILILIPFFQARRTSDKTGEKPKLLTISSLTISIFLVILSLGIAYLGNLIAGWENPVVFYLTFGLSIIIYHSRVYNFPIAFPFIFVAIVLICGLLAIALFFGIVLGAQYAEQKWQLDFLPIVNNLDDLVLFGHICFVTIVVLLHHWIGLLMYKGFSTGGGGGGGSINSDEDDEEVKPNFYDRSSSKMRNDWELGKYRDEVEFERDYRDSYGEGSKW
ncbi:hypothetical protein [Litchfieldia alkalitelluris]|uniref:hypothetical protein n=1 Tax=Litchfieldia alkalitelluris TaxID=304268 RepID=UPI00099876C4|nr:hypothetical protein [Litchfieldia alkalitelluris]